MGQSPASHHASAAGLAESVFAIGIAVLCTVVLGAFAAGTASAEDRAYTCSEKAGTKSFSDAHCVKAEGSKYGHELIKVAETSVTGTNAQTASETAVAAVTKLSGTITGVATEVQCTAVAGTGTLTNDSTEPGLSVSGQGTIEYSGCTVAKPAEKGCKVSGGAVKTNEVSATTLGQATGKVKVSPTSGTTFASVKIESCSIEALNATFPVTGSLIAAASGATLSTTHTGITEQNTFKFGGQKAGIEGALTVKGGSTAAIGLTAAGLEPVSVTAYTCAATESGAVFTDAHCLTSGSGKGFKRLSIAETTLLSGTNSSTVGETAAAAPMKLKGLLGSTETEVECTTVIASGTVENGANGGENVVLAAGAIEFSGCAVTKPAGKGCSVKGERFTTKSLTLATKEQFGAVSASPTTGTELGAVTIEGCSVGINGTKVMTGSVKLNPSGSTLTSTHAETTTQNTLKLDGVKAGLEGSITLKAKTIGGEPVPTPLALVQE